MQTNGDQQRFETLLAAHGGMLWRIVCSYELDPSKREDLHQDVLVAVWRALPKFQGGASEKTYMARIAQNRAITHVTREAARPMLTDIDDAIPDTQESPAANAERGSNESKLHQCVSRLPLPLLQVTTLALEDMPPREIAEVLGISANTVSIRLTRARQRLRVLMGEG